MNKTLLAILVFLALMPSAYGAELPENLTLKKCLTIGIERNSNVVKAGLDKQAADLKTDEALSHGLPQIEGSVQSIDYLQKGVMLLPGELMGNPGSDIALEIGSKYNTTAAIKLNQLLYSQTYFLSLSVTRKLTQLYDLRIEKVKNDFIYDVTKLYLLASITNRQISLIEKNISRLDSIIIITQAQVENGYAKSIDLDRVAVSKSNLQVQLDNTNSLYKQQLNLIKYYIDSPKDILITDTISSLLSALPAPTDQFSLSDRKEIRLLELQKDLNGDNVSAVKYEYLPTLSLIGQLQYQNMREDFKLTGTRWYGTVYFGLNLSIPIFDGFNKKSRVGQAEVDLMKSEADLADTKKYFETSYNNSNRDHITNLSALSRQKKNVDLAENILQVSRIKLGEGSISMSDLLTDETNLCNAEQNYLNTKLQLLNSELELLKSIGKLEILLNK